MLRVCGWLQCATSCAQQREEEERGSGQRVVASATGNGAAATAAAAIGLDGVIDRGLFFHDGSWQQVAGAFPVYAAGVAGAGDVATRIIGAGAASARAGAFAGILGRHHAAQRVFDAALDVGVADLASGAGVSARIGGAGTHAAAATGGAALGARRLALTGAEAVGVAVGVFRAGDTEARIVAALASYAGTLQPLE